MVDQMKDLITGQHDSFNAFAVFTYRALLILGIAGVLGQLIDINSRLSGIEANFTQAEKRIDRQDNRLRYLERSFRNM